MSAPGSALGASRPVHTESRGPNASTAAQRNPPCSENARLDKAGVQVEGKGRQAPTLPDLCM